MKVWAIIVLCAVQVTAAFAQDKTIDGIVFDNNSKERIARVNIVNTRTAESYYNNLKAEFKVKARSGDVLIFSKTGYFNDTVTLKNEATLVIYLKPSSVQLREVSIRSLVTPLDQYNRTKKDYTKIYGHIADKGLLSSISGQGAGLSIDALWNMVSKEGRNATHLRAIIDRDYRENVIDYRFNRTLVGSITGLDDVKLTDFMFKYRPSYYIVTSTNDYDFIKYIRTSYKRYLRNPEAFSLQPLISDDKTAP
ncbi:hypothetical protein BEL04_22450 [Mucilaginibacter sp. PPCGB 2223]|nr:hypothetical protein BEL04_22450 [Mucilaginibacter sp. PPCGB 2223]